ncbi:DUF3159 domain-containing protein [Nocardioides sp. AE5]|uniref:DUF3159 domain-containing protein n=1 Tax=Nocardioides sp. AE5 TaxID=2962573 RepID=UPI0028827792|nr:DUF3159 domain-containing protein [Nocardioides sp. AE5]MDT0201386.1 DUF3159 domain-containing protein [Nocardioides sp. AE5]
MNSPPDEPVQSEEPVRPAATVETVEALVRRQMSTALGGRRGMVEAAVPTLVFTVAFLIGRDLRTALLLSLAVALVALVVRLVQRSSIQFVVNALIGIGIGAFFAMRAGQAGGDANDQALAYFLPGLLYNGGYAVVLSLTCLVRWPAVGFMVGSVTGDVTEWRRDPQLVKLCTRLTWLLVAPCILRVAVQAPVYLAGSQDLMDPGAAVAVLGVAKIVMGWPLQIAALAGMAWLLSRNSIPVEETARAEPA